MSTPNVQLHRANPSERSPDTNSGMKLATNSNKKTRKFTNMWRLNNMVLNNQLIKEEINRKIKQYLDSSEDEKTPTYRMHQMQLKIEAYRGKCIH